MKNFIPTMYQKDIYEINYKKLKKIGIKCILFDLDNTLVSSVDTIFEKRLEKFINSLKKDFKIIIVSNSPKTRVDFFAKHLDVEYISFAIKPLTFKLRVMLKKYKVDELILVGDQLLTDINVGNRLGIKTILVDPVQKKDIVLTKLNRKLENKIIEKLTRKGKLERGKYYE